MLCVLVVSLKKKSKVLEKENLKNSKNKEKEQIPDYVSGGWS